MSTDQNYVGNGSRMGYQHEQMHERRIPVHDRFVPFLAPFLMTLFIVPLLEVISWALCLWQTGYRGMVTIGWCVTGFLISVIAVGIGRTVSKRVPWVYWHVAITGILWGLASAVTNEYGLWTAPPWLVVHAFGSLIVGVSWVLYRIDSLRSAAANAGAKDYWSEVIGLRTSRPRKITQTPAGVEIEIEHGPGETREDVRGAARKLESAIDAVSGRTVVSDVESGRSGSTLVRFSLVDVFKDWMPHPKGDELSHPGMSFAYPLRTGYYETGEWEWFSFAASKLSPRKDCSFCSEMDTFLGAAGTTGSGKSGGINNLAAEALTRTDVIVCWLDRAKIEQNAAWCLDLLGMAANEGKQVHFVRAIRKLADYRVKLFGQAALNAAQDPNADPDAEVGRKWTPELARQTGEAALLVIVDEADTAIKGSGWEWLSARGRSLGIFLYAITPRASAAEVPALVRGSIGAWKTYAIGDNYSEGFTISSEAAEAGADPGRLRSPGLHYLDRAPGLNIRQCATLAREFRSSPGRLRQLVLKYRGRTFQPMGFTQGAIDAMGDDYRQCIPARLLPGWTEPTADDPLPENPDGDDPVRLMMLARVNGLVPATAAQIQEAQRFLSGRDDNTTPADQNGPADDDEDEEDDDDMRPTAQGVDEEAGIARPIDPKTLFDDEEMRYFNGDLEQPIRAEGPELTFRHSKPVWSPEQTEAELDRVIVAFYRAGKRRFGNGEAMESMRCYFNPATCSRRLHALDNGKRTAPGGLSVNNIGRGEFEIVGELDPNYNPPRDTTEEN